MSTLPTTPGYQFFDPRFLQIGNGNAGQYLQTDGAGNLVWANAAGGGGGNGSITLTSNIAAVTAGWPIKVSELTPGSFVIYQEPPQSLTLTSVWVSTGSSTKDAYANVQSNTIVSSDARFNVSLATGAFRIDTGNDYVLIGTSNITGSALSAIGTAGSGTLTVPAANLNSSALTSATVAVTARLTTTVGVATASSSLLNRQPIPFAVNSVSGSFLISSVPYWQILQRVNWSVSVTAASVTSGTANLSNNAVFSETLTSSGALSGTSTGNYVSTAGAYSISANYAGLGSFGAGTGTGTGTVALSTISSYEPVFTKITGSSTNPTFVTTDGRNSANISFPYQISVTSINLTDTLWFAIRDDSANVNRYYYQIQTTLGWTDNTNSWTTQYQDQTIAANGFSRTYQVLGVSGLNTTSGAFNFRIWKI